MPRRIFNLETDLRRSDRVVYKIRKHEIYAQNVYAALCSNDFAPKDMWAVLTQFTWNCTWGYAARMVSEIREIEPIEIRRWYLLGPMHQKDGFVEESTVTDEVRGDLDILGWTVITKRYIDY
jgi:hypothetical protein